MVALKGGFKAVMVNAYNLSFIYVSYLFVYVSYLFIYVSYLFIYLSSNVQGGLI